MDQQRRKYLKKLVLAGFFTFGVLGSSASLGAAASSAAIPEVDPAPDEDSPPSSGAAAADSSFESSREGFSGATGGESETGVLPAAAAETLSVALPESLGVYFRGQVGEEDESSIKTLLMQAKGGEVFQPLYQEKGTEEKEIVPDQHHPAWKITKGNIVLSKALAFLKRPVFILVSEILESLGETGVDEEGVQGLYKRLISIQHLINKEGRSSFTYGELMEESDPVYKKYLEKETWKKKNPPSVQDFGQRDLIEFVKRTFLRGEKKPAREIRQDRVTGLDPSGVASEDRPEVYGEALRVMKRAVDSSAAAASAAGEGLTAEEKLIKSHAHWQKPEVEASLRKLAFKEEGPSFYWRLWQAVIKKDPTLAVRETSGAALPPHIRDYRGIEPVGDYPFQVYLENLIFERESHITGPKLEDLLKSGATFEKRLPDGETLLDAYLERILSRWPRGGGAAAAASAAAGRVSLGERLTKEVEGIITVIERGYGRGASPIRLGVLKDKVASLDAEVLETQLTRGLKGLENIHPGWWWHQSWTQLMARSGATPLKDFPEGHSFLSQTHTDQLFGEGGIIKPFNYAREAASPSGVSPSFPAGAAAAASSAAPSLEEGRQIGRRRVGRIFEGSVSLCFKEYPEFPGLEYAVTTLMDRVVGEGGIPSRLVKINHRPFLVTPYVPVSLAGLLETRDTEALKKLKMGPAILAALLTNPEDGTPYNYGVIGDRLIGIDNDHSFGGSAPATQKEGTTVYTPHVKSVVFAMDTMMDPIEDKWVDQMAALSPLTVIEEWLTHLVEVDTRYKDLFTAKEQADLRKPVLNQKEETKVLAALKEQYSHWYTDKIEQWLHMISRYQPYEGSLSQEDQDLLARTFEKKQPDLWKKIQEGHSPTYTGVFLTETMVLRLLEKLYKLQKEAKEEQANRREGVGDPARYIDLIDRVEPPIAARYKKSFERFPIDPANPFASVLERFKAADAEHFQKSVRGDLISRTTTEGYLANLLGTPEADIHVLQTLLKEKAPRIRIGPAAVLDALPRLTGRTHEMRRDLGSKPKEYANLVTPAEKADFIRQLNWDELPEAVQDNWLMILKEGYRKPKEEEGAAGSVEKDLLEVHHSVRGWYSLALRNFSRLTDAQFQSLPLGRIQELTLKKVPSLSLRSLEGVKDRLQVLKLEGFGWGFFRNTENLHVRFFDSLPLCFLQLTNLCLCEARNLRDIVLEAPKLTYLQIQDVPQLETLRVEAPQLRYLEIGKAPQLKKIAPFESRYLREISLKKPLGLTAIEQRWFKVLPALDLELLRDYKEDAVNNLIRGIEQSLSLIKDDDIRAQMYQLQPLNLMGVRIGNNGAKLLAKMTVLSQLTDLNLRNNHIGHVGARALAASRAFPQLTLLNLGGDMIAAAGAEALAASTNLTQLTSLDLRGNEIGAGGARALAASRAFPQLTLLNLGGDMIGDEGARALAESTTLTQLTDLNLGENKIGDAGIEALEESTTLTQLTSLSLWKNKIGEAGVRALAVARALTQLTNLNLGHNGIRVAGVRALAASRALTQLTHLNLRGNEIGDNGAKLLAEMTVFPQLTDLNLGENKIGDAGIEALAESTTLTQLTDLDLRGNKIGDKGAAALATSRVFPQLTNLNLRDNKIEDEGIRALAASTTLTRLTYLNLGENKIEDAGARVLAASRAFPKLTGLDLRINKIGEAGIKELASSRFFPQLTHLDLRINEIGDAGIKELASSRAFPQLTYLNLGSNNIGDAGIEELASSMILTRVENLNLRGNEIGEAGARALAKSKTLTKLNRLELIKTEIGEVGRKALQDAHLTWGWESDIFYAPALFVNVLTYRVKDISETTAVGPTWPLVSPVSVSGAGAAAASSAAVVVTPPRFLPVSADVPQSFWKDTSLSLIVLTHQAWPAVGYLQEKVGHDLRGVIADIGVTGSASFMGLAWALPHWALPREEKGIWSLEDLLEQWGPSTSVSRFDLTRTFRKGGVWTDVRLDDRDIHSITVGLASETTYIGGFSPCTVQKACEEALGSKPYDVSLGIIQKQARLLPKERVKPLLVVLGSIEKTEEQEEALKAFYEEVPWAYQRVDISTVADSTGAAAAASGAGERLFVEEEPSVHLSPETKAHLDQIYEQLLNPLVKARFPEEEEL